MCFLDNHLKPQQIEISFIDKIVRNCEKGPKTCISGKGKIKMSLFLKLIMLKLPFVHVPFSKPITCKIELI